MALDRKLDRIITLPPPTPGQFGPDHTAIELIGPGDFAAADPFIALMDDRLDGRLQAGPHPHAGFETVTFVVEGSIGAEGGPGSLEPGDVEWTTAGSGIVHGPTAPIEGRLRVLQLWVTLPQKDRWTEPDHQIVPASSVPVRREPGAEIRLYSGSIGALRSTTRNRVPLTIADVRLEAGAEIEQTLPATYNGFLYVLAGRARAGGARLESGQVGWLDRSEGSLRIAAEGGPVRLLLYAGERQNAPIVSYGPFIGDTRADIVRSFQRYQAGSFVDHTWKGPPTTSRNA